jgi:hypothetical protein
MMLMVIHAVTMTENLATPERDDLAASILAPKDRWRAPIWVLAVSVVVAFVLGWLIPAPAGPTGSAPQPSQSATVPEVDNEDDSAFVRVANRDLEDFSDDLDDLDVTLDEDGFWRLLTNTAELKFNLEQLQKHSAPESIEADWSDGLAQLDDDVSAIQDAVTASSDKRVRAAVAGARETVEGLLGVVTRVD